MTVVAAAVVPMTPLLFRHLSGIADPVAELREACVATVRETVADAEQVVVLAPVVGREAPRDWRDPSLPARSPRQPVPLSVQVADQLLELAWCVLPTTYAELPGVVTVPEGPVALLVMGDGAAARSEGAPGHIDQRSFVYDDHVAALLGAGDGIGLTELDDRIGADLMATGRMSWPMLGHLMPEARAELRYRDDPFGVSYFVALWRPE